MSDNELLEQYRSGSQAAFAELVRRHGNWVYSVARRRVREANLAEDVTQAVFILLARKSQTIGPQTRLAAWLMKVTCFAASHAMRDARRRERHETAALARSPGCDESPAARAELQDLAAAVDRCVRSLPGRDQQALLLRFYRQQEIGDIAAELNLSPVAARKRIHRALERLRAALVRSGLNLSPVDLGAWLHVNVIQSAPPRVIAAGRAAASGSGGNGMATSIAKGANRMLVIARSKLVVAIVLLVILPGILCIHLLDRRANAQDEVTAPDAVTTVASNATPMPQAAAVPEPDNFMTAGHVALAFSADHKRVWGYSATTGQWVSPRDPVGDSDSVPRAAAASSGAPVAIRPVINDQLIVFQSGNRLYGFGGAAGRWDELELPPGVQAEPVVEQQFGMARWGTHIAMFSPQTAQWQVIDTASPQ